MKDIIAMLRCLLTLPGALCQSFWELLCCKLTHTALTAGEFLRKDGECGHLRFDPPRAASGRVLLCALPFLCNLLLGIPMLLTSTVNIFLMHDPALVEWIMLWVGWSLLCCVYPSVSTAQALRNALRDEGTPRALKLICAPAVWFFLGGAHLSRWCLTLPLAAGGAALIPWLMGCILV